MNQRTLLATGLAAFAIGLVACLPLSLFLPASGQDGLHYNGASGTVWQGGSVTGVRYKGVPVGTVDIEPSISALLTGAIGGDIRVRGSFLNGTGHVSAGDGIVAQDASLRVALAGLQLPLPLDGALELAGFNARIEGDRCVEASGNVRLVADLAGNAGLLPPLRGTAACEDGQLVLRLQGAARGTNLGLAAWIAPVGGYHLTADLATTEADIRRVLPYMGFVQAGNSFKLEIKGRWQGD
ncbi:type II secretion system protein N [Gimibacter soli]|uniref:Type II secretion system protein N n=1 Tax=Gimibacter soli TaxID=3024400 RepID=A0AAF0BK09_9PROT|nr:type II secretion system protein N [Gimibacter soli]WCL53744.1 type II secretion system protein N [Gimibacter soli]